MSPLPDPRPTRNHDPLPATGRAGRNLPAAIGAVVVLIAMVLGSLTSYKAVFVGAVVLTVCRALWKLAVAFARKRIRLPLAPLWLGIPGVSVCVWKAGVETAFGAYVVTVGAYVLWSLMGRTEAEVGIAPEQAGHGIPRTEAHDEVCRSCSSATAASVFVAAYLPSLAGSAVLLLVQKHGVGKVMMLITLATTNDIGGQMVGITFGRHPLASLVSLKKFWEELMGPLTIVVTTGVGCVWAISGPWWIGAALDACTTIASTLGDLGESLLKQDLGLKDMGTLLLGHGGIMDRLNSILMAAPLIYIFILLVKQERMPHLPLSISPAFPNPET